MSGTIIREHNAVVNEWFTVYQDSGGEAHRLDGPAVIWDDGDYGWFCHGLPHRIGGPSAYHHCSSADGRTASRTQWHVHGKKYGEAEYFHLMWDDYCDTASVWFFCYGSRYG